MARLYADEQYPLPIVELLRSFEHDVLRVQEAGNEGLSDDRVLAFATQEDRAVLTLNRRHFIRLHQSMPNHAGMITCSLDQNWENQAALVNAAIASVDSLSGKLIRIYKSSFALYEP